MPLNVHLLHEYSPEIIDYLTDRLDEGIRVTTGEHAIPTDDLQILVAGRPDRELIVSLPNLQALIVPWVGIPPQTRQLITEFSHFSLHNIHHNAQPVAEMAMALLLSAAKQVVPFDRALRQGDWRPRYQQPPPSLLLSGRTAVVLGYGAIGRLVARMCQAINMSVLATRRTIEPGTGDPYAQAIYPSGELHQLLPHADALIITLPLTADTEGLLGSRELSLLPSPSVLVNVGRGAIVDESALYHALASRTLSAAGLDVWYNYPSDEEERAHTLPANYPLWELDNVVLSPHRAGLTSGIDFLRMRHLAVLLNAAAKDEPMPNKVDVKAGY